MIYAGIQTALLAGPNDSGDNRMQKKRTMKNSPIKGGLSKQVRKKIENIASGAVYWQAPLADYSTLKVGGPAWAVVMPGSRDAFAAMVAMLSEEEIPWWIIGRGSNVLVPDEGLAGVVLVMGRQFAAISGPHPIAPQVTPDGARKTDLFEIEVEAGCSLARLLRWAVEHELSGLEFTAGIPGSVGGAIRMNAGAWGREMADCVSRLTVMDNYGYCQQLQGGEAGFIYRAATALADKIVLSAVLQMVKSEKALIEDACQAIIHQRLTKQPLHSASAGS
ncbi:MAG: FAD-binding protein [Deltaproteobacteria bacterium]